MTFKKDSFFGYSVRVSQLSEADGGGWLASIPELPGCLADGETPDAAYAELKDVLEFWLQVAKEQGKDVSDPAIYEEIYYSGKTVLRMPKNLHRILSKQAELEGVSLNQYMVSLLSYNAGKYEHSASKEPTTINIWVEQIYDVGKQRKYSRERKMTQSPYILPEWELR